jgi:hypothetical protein
LAKVLRRDVGPDGNVKGSYDDNPMKNSVVNEAKFPDVQIK